MARSPPALRGTTTAGQARRDPVLEPHEVVLVDASLVRFEATCLRYLVMTGDDKAAARAAMQFIDHLGSATMVPLEGLIHRGQP